VVEIAEKILDLKPYDRRAIVTDAFTDTIGTGQAGIPWLPLEDDGSAKVRDPTKGLSSPDFVVKLRMGAKFPLRGQGSRACCVFANPMEALCC
jgi:hypothetical protein